MSGSSKGCALVTGGAGRIGAQLARDLHRRGLDVAVHYHRSHSAAQALAAELNQNRPASVLLLAGDLGAVQQFDGWMAQIAEQFGRLDLLVHNASTFYPTPVGTITLADWDELINPNQKAPLFLSQAAVPLLQQSGGCIVHVLDIHAERPLRNHSLYCMAKAGQALLVKALARDLAPEIRVNGIAPGAILWPEGWSDAIIEQRILDKIALRRLGDPEDIARALWFLFREAPYVTGQILAVDGGRSLNQ